MITLKLIKKRQDILINFALKQQMRAMFNSNSDQVRTLDEIFSELKRPDGDPDTRRTLWQMLNNGEIEMTLDRKYKKS